MSSTEAQRRKLRQIQEVAKNWGKLLAREAFPGGPGLDVSLTEMEELAAAGCSALVRGAIETMTGDQAEQLPQEVPCPICGRMCGLERRPRPVKVHGGEATLDEPVAHCPTCRRDFFPATSGVEG